MKKSQEKSVEKSKKQWTTPKLKVHGDMEKITQGVTGTVGTDGSSEPVK